MAHGKPHVVVAHLPVQQGNATAALVALLLRDMEEKAEILRRAQKQPRIYSNAQQTAYNQGKLDALDGIIFTLKNGLTR